MSSFYLLWSLAGVLFILEKAGTTNCDMMQPTTQRRGFLL